MDTDGRNVIEWLRSPDGEKWSQLNHNRPSCLLVSIKGDDESDPQYKWEAVWVVRLKTGWKKKPPG